MPFAGNKQLLRHVKLGTKPNIRQTQKNQNKNKIIYEKKTELVSVVLS